VKLTAEIADGWLPLFFSPTRWKDAFGDAFTGTDFSTFDVAPSVTVILGDDVDACRSFVKPQLALYVGGMGARGKNFYNDLVCRYGFEAEATKIQDLYLDGQKQDATAAVPDELVDEVALCGPKERIRDLLDKWKESPVTTMIVGTGQPEALEVMAELTA
jgi:alkanesulfonate monooxygenase SsuD/methylene tetrahydromethanopterin reductase-like flavin-dependent oxidoreductase (luciferase family)